MNVLVFSCAWHSTPERESLITVLLKPDREARCLRSTTNNSSTRLRVTAMSMDGRACSTTSKNISPEMPQVQEQIMQAHQVVSRQEWIAARKAHLEHEKEFTKARER